MRNIVLLVGSFLILTTVSAQNTGRLFDQPMKIKTFNIGIQSDVFTATTFIEIEFYNPNDKEIEGLYRFRLEPGQVITAFQLDLNGKYRDGSIEEKWKARSAYGSIVGKRMDPALLQYEYNNNYRLNIYPVPAKGSRRVTFTIQQLLKENKGNLDYVLPMNNYDSVGQFNVNINVQSTTIPFTDQGLISGKSFSTVDHIHKLEWKTNNILLKNSLAFSIPIPADPVMCVKPGGQRTNFLLRFKPAVSKQYELHPKKLVVFWDVSASTSDRNTNKEINFLRQYISFYNISQLTVIPFNYKLLDTAVFFAKDGFSSLKQYIERLEYGGATQLGCIDLRGFNADLFMIFTDGRNTFGKKIPFTGSSTVHCVYTTNSVNIVTLSQIVGTSGGKIIDLNKVSLGNALSDAGIAENWLINVTSSAGKLVVEQSLPMKLTESFFINGTTASERDTLIFHYGNNNQSNFTEKIVLHGGKYCMTDTPGRVSMLNKFNDIIYFYSWEDVLDFGLKEKIVTPNTSYIVLEKVEDYMKYNITPPKELEEECEKLNYVKKDTRSQRRQLKEADEFEILNGVATAYNDKLRKWDATIPQIKLTKTELAGINNKSEGSSSNAWSNSDITDKKPVVASVNNTSGEPIQTMQEVVVTTAFGIKRSARTTPFSTQVISNEELNIIPQTNLNAALAGKVAGVQFRGQSPILLDKEGFLRIRGGLSLSDVGAVYVIDGTVVNSFDINPDDIESLNILKGANATALFGEQAKNGAIVITTRKRNYNYYYYGYRDKSYRLKDREDVDYMQEIKSTSLGEMEEVYLKLKNQNEYDPGFYFDMAQYFYEHGMKQDAKEILMNAAEMGAGNAQVQMAMGFILESWNEFESAISIYKQLTEDGPFDLHVYRNLALAYYQNGEYQKAVDTLYAGIKFNTNNEIWSRSLKVVMLSEMNAIIFLHKTILDLSSIPASLIQPITADLRITLDYNFNGMSGVHIKEPGLKNHINKDSARQPGNNKMVSYQLTTDYYYFPIYEYQARNANEGKYKIKVNYYDYYYYRWRQIPAFIRIMTFKNFGKENESIQIENVIMDNQYGEVEIAEVKW